MFSITFRICGKGKIIEKIGKHDEDNSVEFLFLEHSFSIFV